MVLGIGGRARASAEADAEVDADGVAVKAKAKAKATVDERGERLGGTHLFDSCTRDLSGELEGIENQLREEAVDLAYADAQVAVWSRLDGTANVTDATKNAYVRVHLNHWKDLSAKLRASITTNRTHEAGLKLLIAATMKSG